MNRFFERGKRRVDVWENARPSSQSHADVSSLKREAGSIDESRGMMTTK